MADAYTVAIAAKHPHGPTLAGVLGDVVGSAEIMANLSPPARGVATVLSQSFERGLGIGLDAADVGALPTAVMNSIANLAVGTVQEVLGAVKALVAGSDAAQAVGAVSDIVPFLTGMVGLVISALPGGSLAASGVGPASSDPGVRAAYCQGSYAPIHGSGGVGQEIVACDVFTNTSRDGLGVRREPSLGSLLESSLEDPWKLEPVKVLTLGPPKKGFFRVPGLPRHVQSLFRRMRLAMVAGCIDPSWDGGNSLLPLYIDLFRMQRQLGRINSDWLEWQARCSLDWIHPEVRQYGETCLRYEKRAWHEMLGLLETWDNTLVPKHDPGGVKAAAIARSEAQIIAQANLALGMRTLRQYGAQLAPHVRTRPVHVTRRLQLQRRTTNAKHLAVGVGVLGAAAGIGWKLLL